MRPLRRFKAISHRDNLRSEEQRPKMAFRSLAVAPTRLLKRGRFLFKHRDMAVTFEECMQPATPMGTDRFVASSVLEYLLLNSRLN